MSRSAPTAEDVGQAMRAIFATPAGLVLHAHLTKVAMTMSAVKPTTAGVLALADQRSTDIAEGRRWLAIEMLGAPNQIEGGKDG